MKWNKAFIFVTGASYFGLAILASFGYPTMITPNPGTAPLTIVYTILGVVFILWSLSPLVQHPRSLSYFLALLYGVVAALTFVGFESWGSVTQNVAMAAWDLACALCFAVE